MKQKRILMVLSVLILAAFACNAPAQGQPATPTVDINTAIVQTLTAGAPTLAPQTNTPTLSEATATQAMSDTPAPTATPAASTTAIPTPCNAAMFVSDITVPDGASIQAGTSFVKTWQFKNVGTCAWNPSYQLIFLSGDAMGAPATTPMTAANILPNGIVNVSISLTAPAAAGTYQANFKLRAPDGTIFGIGNSANDPFWTKINSTAAAATAVPTAVPSAVPSATLGAIKLPVLTLIPIFILKPDLRVTNLSILPTPVHANALQNISVTIYNGGSIATSGSFTVKFWAYPGDPSPCGWVVNQPIAVGGGLVEHCTSTWNQAYLGGVNSTATVDTGNTIAESNEANNSYTVVTIVH